MKNHSLRRGLRQLVEDRMGAFYSTPHGQHFRNARREMLLAVRALVDQRLQWLDSLGQTDTEPHHVEVE